MDPAREAGYPRRLMARQTVFGQAGPYDDQARRVLIETGAALAVVIVLDGKHGRGISVASDTSRPGAAEMAMGGIPLATLLRQMASVLEGGYQPDGGVLSSRR